MIFDGHIHISYGDDSGTWKRLLESKTLGMLANTSSPDEFERVRGITENDNLKISFGIHPWDVGKLFENEDVSQEQINKKLSELEYYYVKADSIGEIGMDNVWCDCDISLQKQIFVAQMNIAQKLRKPVILHTKGLEKEIFEIIKKYSVKKLVHWYSCQEHLQDYIFHDCYFTIGPDYQSNDAVMNVLRSAPLHRILVESDGLEAVHHATKEKLSEQELPDFLKKTIKEISASRHLSYPMTETILHDNIKRFLK